MNLNRSILKAAAFLLSAAAVLGCKRAPEVMPAIAPDAEVEARVEKVLKGMTLEEKVGQVVQLSIDIISNEARDDVDPATKTRRLNEIIALQNRKSLESYRADIGKRFTVLVEGPSKRNPDELCGRASNNKMCVFPALPDLKPGDYAEVEITGCTSATLLARLA